MCGVKTRKLTIYWTGDDLLLGLFTVHVGELDDKGQTVLAYRYSIIRLGITYLGYNPDKYISICNIRCIRAMFCL